AQVEINVSSPPVVNDPVVTSRIREAVRHVDSPYPLRWPDNVRWMPAEDMAFFLEKVPGTFLFIGSANSARKLDYPHHHPQFDFDEDALPISAGLLATAIADFVLPE